MDVHTPEQRRRNMQAIRSKETKEEIALAKALWKLGYRYRKNNKKVYGTPDLTFSRKKLAIFIDGEFFHGFDWSVNKHRIKTNQSFWWNKIERNIARDLEVNEKLIGQGWTVLRFWSKQVKKELDSCLKLIEQALINHNC